MCRVRASCPETKKVRCLSLGKDHRGGKTTEEDFCYRLGKDLREGKEIA
jgi:hypothetical protein